MNVELKREEYIMSIDKRKDDLRQRIKDVHEELKILEEWETNGYSVDIPVSVTEPLPITAYPQTHDVNILSHGDLLLPEDGVYIPTLGQIIFRVSCPISGVVAFHTFELTHLGVQVVDPYRALRIGEEE